MLKTPRLHTPDPSLELLRLCSQVVQGLLQRLACFGLGGFRVLASGPLGFKGFGFRVPSSGFWVQASGALGFGGLGFGDLKAWGLGKVGLFWLFRAEVRI